MERPIAENPNTEKNASRELIAFRVGEENFCVDVMKVREIRGWSPVTAVPHAPNAMLGVINLRGLVLPIIDLSIRMGFAAAQVSKRHVIMVVEIGHQIVGLIVDAVSEIFTVRADEVQPTPDVASKTSKELIQGVIAGKERMISVLSLEKVTDIAAAARL